MPIRKQWIISMFFKNISRMLNCKAYKYNKLDHFNQKTILKTSYKPNLKRLGENFGII